MVQKPTKVRTATAEYETGRAIGEGAAGVVFEAKDEDGAQFAIKIIKSAVATREKLKRFRNELHFCIQNRDPRIVPVLDHGLASTADGDAPFYVMPLYSATLRWIMRNRLSPEAAFKVSMRLLDCVEAAHLQGVWHRDLKPENFLIDPPTGDLVLADFGAAHLHRDSLLTSVDTAPDARLANFAYAAPEQRRPSGAINHKADLFALGLLIAEVFTGQVRQGSGYIQIGAVAPQFAYLDDIVEWLRQQEPDARPDSIDAVRLRMTALEKEAGARQRLDALTRTIVPANQTSDPLVRQPPRVTGVDYHDSKLTLALSISISAPWVDVFRNLNIGETLNGAGVRDFVWGGNQASVHLPRLIDNPTAAQQVIDDFKRMLDATSRLYAERVLKALRRQEKEERQRLVEEQKKEAIRLKMLSELRP